MATTNDVQPAAERSARGSRAGYVAAILVNGVLLYVANNLLAWDVLPFLTDQFTRVLPLVNLSLVTTIAVNAAYLAYDEQWFTSLTQILLLGLSMAATVRLYRVFPFDFAGYGFAWATVVRTVLVLALVGVAIAVVVEVTKLGAALARR